MHQARTGYITWACRKKAEIKTGIMSAIYQTQPKLNHAVVKGERHIVPLHKNPTGHD